MVCRTEVDGADPVGEPGTQCVVSRKSRRVGPLEIPAGNSQYSCWEAG